MRKGLIISTCLVILASLGTDAFSQGAVFDPISHTSHLPGGMTFSSDMQLTNSDGFMKDFDQYSFHPILNKGSLNAFGTYYNVKGSRLLFEDWVKGSVIKNSGEEISEDRYSYNFDKITNNLIVTYDKQLSIEVYKDSIKSFAFKEKDKLYYFEKSPSIEPYRFVQVLIKNKGKYSLYKSVHTRFVGSDFQTNGLTESGNPYDEFVDICKYYIVYKEQVRPVELKFTSIKKALKENFPRARDYYAEHLMDEVDESYLTGIVEYINQ